MDCDRNQNQKGQLEKLVDDLTNLGNKQKVDADTIQISKQRLNVFCKPIDTIRNFAEGEPAFETGLEGNRRPLSGHKNAVPLNRKAE